MGCWEGIIELDTLCISSSNGFFPTQGCKYILPNEKNYKGMLVVATKSYFNDVSESFIMLFGKSVV